MNEETRDLIRRIVDDPEIRNCLYLVKNNVPFDVAFSLKPHQAMAWSIIFGEFEGGQFDWSAMQWKKQDS